MKTEDIKVVDISQFYAVSPQTIFDFWTVPELARQWLFVGTSSKIIEIKIDLEIKGKFSITEFDDQKNDTIEHFGEYHVIRNSDWLEFTLSVPKHFPGITNVILQIEKRKNGCELRLLQTGVEPEIIESNWKEMLLNLKSLVETKRVPAGIKTAID